MTTDCENCGEPVSDDREYCRDCRCDLCDGTGEEATWRAYFDTCRACHGTGRRQPERDDAPGKEEVMT